jgi:two-component system, NtrC family, response regulator HydG
MSASDGHSVLVVEDDPIQQRLLTVVLQEAGWRPVLATTAAEALRRAEVEDLAAVLLDLVLPDRSGEELLGMLRERCPSVPVIVLSAQDSVARAVEIMRQGPYDYLVKPVDPDRVVRVLARAAEERRLRHRVEALEREVRGAYRFDEIIGSSPRMQGLYDQMERVLSSRVTVLITGESGTGKELVAKALHVHGARAKGPFVALNCGAIPEHLQESELFGHERGSFTGAVGTHRGRFEQAHRGTLFLDEVGELSLATQTRLLRVLQESEIQRVGGTTVIPVDVRIISATHRDLEAMVAAGTFREDLYYRLVVFPLELPALRSRPEDIPALLRHFLRRYRAETGGAPREFDRDAIDVLVKYDWPGNVRELENVVQRALVATPRGSIGVAALPPRLVLRAMGLAEGSAMPTDAGTGVPTTPTKEEIVPLDQLERRAIEQALHRLDGNVSLAAQRLGIGRATLYRRLAQYGLLQADASAS